MVQSSKLKFINHFQNIFTMYLAMNIQSTLFTIQYQHNSPFNNTLITWTKILLAKGRVFNNVPMRVGCIYTPSMHQSV